MAYGSTDDRAGSPVVAVIVAILGLGAIFVCGAMEVGLLRAILS